MPFRNIIYIIHEYYVKEEILNVSQSLQEPYLLPVAHRPSHHHDRTLDGDLMLALAHQCVPLCPRSLIPLGTLSVNPLHRAFS